MGDLGRQNRTDKSTFRTGADHFPIDEAIIRRHRLAFSCPGALCFILSVFPPRHAGSPGQISGRTTGRDIIGAWQIVIRQRGQVQHIIMGVLGTFPTRGLVERIAHKEMRAGKHQLTGMFREACLTADGAVTLGIGFIKHDGSIIVTRAVPQFVSGLDKAGQHVQQFPRVQGRQARGQGRGARYVIEGGQQGQTFLVQTHDAVTVSHGVPVACVRLDAAHLARAVMGKTGIYGLGGEQIGQIIKAHLFLGVSVNIQAETQSSVVICAGKQGKLIFKLEMCSQAGIDCLPEGAAIGVIIDAFRMHEGGNAPGRVQPPGLGQETFVQIGLHTPELGIVLQGIEEGLRACGLRVFA